MDKATADRIYTLGDKKPVSPEVAELVREFGDIRPKDIVLHEKIEAIIGCKRKTARYRSVIKAWKEYERLKLGKVIESARGKGYECLSFDDTIAMGASVARGIARRAQVHVERINAHTPETDMQRRQQLYDATRFAAIAHEAMKRQIEERPYPQTSVSTLWFDAQRASSAANQEQRNDNPGN